VLGRPSAFALLLRNIQRGEKGELREENSDAKRSRDRGDGRSQRAGRKGRERRGEIGKPIKVARLPAGMCWYQAVLLACVRMINEEISTGRQPRRRKVTGPYCLRVPQHIRKSKFWENPIRWERGGNVGLCAGKKLVNLNMDGTEGGGEGLNCFRDGSRLSVNVWESAHRTLADKSNRENEDGN